MTRQQTTEALTRGTAKVTVYPIDHYVGARQTRRTWVAAVNPRTWEGDTPAPAAINCPHDAQGHRTSAAAATCGTALWKQLPA